MLQTSVHIKKLTTFQDDPGSVNGRLHKKKFIQILSSQHATLHAYIQDEKHTQSCLCFIFLKKASSLQNREKQFERRFSRLTEWHGGHTFWLMNVTADNKASMGTSKSSINSSSVLHSTSWTQQQWHLRTGNFKIQNLQESDCGAQLKNK